MMTKSAMAAMMILCATAAPVVGEIRDSKALAVADEVMAAGGGEAGLASAKVLKFTFVYEQDGVVRSSRTHYWDRIGGRHRLEMIDRDGKNITCLTHLPSKEGVCAVDGQGFMEEAAQPYLSKSYAIWINDTYWLLMPYKMKDPGVDLKFDGETKEGGKTYDKIQLSFDQVGLTPKDRYWAFVDRTTHRMDKWAFVLQDEKGEPGKGEPSVFKWTGWSKFGSLWLSTEKIAEDGKSKVVFKDVAVFEALPDEIFSETSKVRLP